MYELSFDIISSIRIKLRCYAEQLQLLWFLVQFGHASPCRLAELIRLKSKSKLSWHDVKLARAFLVSSGWRIY